MENSLQRYERVMANAAGRLSLGRLRARYEQLPVSDPRFGFIAGQLEFRLGPCWEG